MYFTGLILQNLEAKHNINTIKFPTFATAGLTRPAPAESPRAGRQQG